jgi:NADH dehydrogenase
MASDPPRILIAGGGFVGMYTALGLERTLAAHEAQLELVAPENFMCYQPLLPEVASGSIEPRHAVVPLRKVLARTHVTLGRLAGLDPDTRQAKIEPSDGPARELRYDHIVLGLGAVTRLLPVPGLVDVAVGFSTLTEALHLRNQVLSRLEAAEAATEPGVRQRALTFVFVGGGYAGVEALAELEAMAREACASYRTIAPSQLRWVLVEATDRILPSMDAGLAKRAETLLRERGIDVRLETEVKSAEEGKLRLSDGEELEADTLVWMPGVAPHPVAGELGLPCDDRGRLRVDECLRVADREGAWAAGDCAAVPDGDGGLHPPTAQHAEREAHQLADNLARVLRGQAPEPFRYRSRGEFVTLGGRRGVAKVMRAQLRGATAWALRRAYYLGRMPSTERRLRLAVDWTVGLPFQRDVAQLGGEQHPDQPLAQHADS